MTTNERLRDALMRAGLDTQGLAQQLEVDPKTIERWITKGRTPYPKTRAKAAAILAESASYLWPDAVSGERKDEISDSEIIRVYQRRSQISQETWSRLIDTAKERIHLMAFAGLFLPEQHPKLAQTLCEKAQSGADVRVLLGNPDGDEVARRGTEEEIGEAMAAKVRNVMTFYGDHAKDGCFEVRLHDTVLYNSIYRFDNEMLVNTHVLGVPAAHAPVLHLRQLPGGEMFDLYAGSLNQVWQQAEPAWPT